MTVTWGLDARRKGLALLAAVGLLASLIGVFSAPALGTGNSPSVECGSTDPAWNGDYWKVQNDNGTLGTVETNVAGAITLDADGSWTNNENPVFRVVLKVGEGVGDDQVLSGDWETGEGGSIDLALTGLAHVTFCFKDEVPEESEQTTTSTSPTTTTSTISTTTTSVGPTTTTSPAAGPPTTPGESTPTPASDETTTNGAANSTEASDSAAASSVSQADGSGKEADGSSDGSDWQEPEGSSLDADRDATVAAPMNGGSGEPSALGQAPISSNAVPDATRNSEQWPTLEDLATLGVLIAAIAVLNDRSRLRRLVEKAHVGRRGR
jgi:hypothetical protein